MHTCSLSSLQLYFQLFHNECAFIKLRLLILPNYGHNEYKHKHVKRFVASNDSLFMMFSIWCHIWVLLPSFPLFIFFVGVFSTQIELAIRMPTNIINKLAISNWDKLIMLR